MERGEQEIPGRVTGEHPPGAIPAMGRRREAQQQDPRRRIAEAGHRPSPVGLVTEPRDLLPGDGLAPGDQPRAASARLDLGGEGRQGGPPGPVRRSLSSRRDTTNRPANPTIARYATWNSRTGLIAPTVSERMRATPCESGVRRTPGGSAGGYVSIG